MSDAVFKEKLCYEGFIYEMVELKKMGKRSMGYFIVC